MVLSSLLLVSCLKFVRGNTLTRAQILGGGGGGGDFEEKERIKDEVAKEVINQGTNYNEHLNTLHIARIQYIPFSFKYSYTLLN